MALKPGDQWTVPMCYEHHSEQHAVGEHAFWVMGILRPGGRPRPDPIALALSYARRSPDPAIREAAG